MSLNRNASVSLLSFLGGTGVLSFFIIYYYDNWAPLPDWVLWTKNHAWIYPILYFAAINIFIKILYWNEEWLVALCGCFLGVIFGSGLLILVLNLYGMHLFGSYLMVLAFFHYSEYFTTAVTNSTTLTLDSYLLNHSISYWIAACASWLEYFLELWFIPSLSLWYISVAGAGLCIFGEITRKLAMFTAEKNFNHIVQVRRQSGHKLVTHGVYRWFRHPSYVGWFWWSIGTQVLLVNPVCIILYTAASWVFFNERVHFEEMTLINFFGEEYLEYQKKVSTGLPFIKGYYPKER